MKTCNSSALPPALDQPLPLWLRAFSVPPGILPPGVGTQIWRNSLEEFHQECGAKRRWSCLCRDVVEGPTVGGAKRFWEAIICGRASIFDSLFHQKKSTAIWKDERSWKNIELWKLVSKSLCMARFDIFNFLLGILCWYIQDVIRQAMVHCGDEWQNVKFESFHFWA